MLLLIKQNDYSNNMFQIKRIGKQFLQKILFKFGFQIYNVFYFDFFNSLLHQLLKKQQNLTFLQIGANDGVRYDPIYKFVTQHHHHIKGVVLEPVKDYYLELQKNYKNYKNIKTINKAIHHSLQETTIYRLDKSKEKLAPDFAKGIASFDPLHHKKTNVNSDFIKAEIVKCVNLATVIKENNIEKLDVLVIDTEGYDYQIIKSIDFNYIQPKLIHFEHGLKLQTMSDNQFKEIQDILQQNKYQLFVNTSDATAYKTNILFDSLK